MRGAACGVLAALCVLASAPCAAQDPSALAEALRPGAQAFERLLPELDAMAGPMSRDVLDGKADLHVFYGLVTARLLYVECQDTLSLWRSARAQECPALGAALLERLTGTAQRLEGAADLIEGALPMTGIPRMGLVGHAATRAIRAYVAPIKALDAAREKQAL
ncbi:hypothetical protein NNJEOMEG_00745 [Fundidesulfovibrio magnetotacticus]|uniref:Uncharacterized protein n=1 Tax=Fundidesulfovibrio magnetotacticus TaxID=2730080 RepID=A0A6V8LTF2_9BACT|nr:hypothetical protein [Fundidesulfovibrio magnetotacticus]GFK92917.1 hypothetical protein NNJEOMEG_00745 [Fundidesulfovibrio magnetotacticus]